MNERAGSGNRTAAGGRSGILARIRKNIPDADDPARAVRVKERLAKTPSGLIPARGRKPHDKQVDLFCEQAAKVQATVTRISTIADLPAALADYLRGRNLPKRVRMGDAPLLAGADWEKAAGLEISKGASDGSDPVGLSHAFAGDYESVWSRVREKHGKGQMPRTVNMITGPSRSGDIEQTLLLGAHGPRSLQIFVLDSDG